MSDAARVGGKAASLARLTKLGMPVPPWFVVEARHFAAAVSAVGADALAEAPVSDELAADVDAGLARLAGGTATPLLAVRSSGADEDGASASFAGQYETVLGVRGRDEVLAAIRRCWAAAFAPRVAAYRSRHGLDPAAASMAVIVQVLVEARAAGVAFSRDPQLGEGTIAVQAVWGLGDLLVSGEVDATQARFDIASDSVTIEPAHQDVELAWTADGSGIAQRPVDPDLAGRPAVDEPLVRRVADLAQRIERAWNAPCDIEFAIDMSGDVSLLQARPITVAAHPPAGMLARSINGWLDRARQLGPTPRSAWPAGRSPKPEHPPVDGPPASWNDVLLRAAMGTPSEDLREDALRVLHTIGTSLVDAGALQRHEDIDLLTADELVALWLGTSPTVDLDGLLAARRSPHGQQGS